MSLDNVEDAFGLSPIQKGMLYDSLLHPDTDVYTAYVTIEIEGTVDTDHLQNSVADVFHWHQALKAEFHWQGLDDPLQVIRKSIVLNWTQYDWSDRTNWDHNRFKSELIKQERLKNISITTAPLFRFVLVKKADNKWLLLWVVHHLLADGISTPVLLSQIINRYATGSEKKPEDIYQYSQYINWLKTQNQSEAQTYWQQYLNKAKSTPFKLTRPSPSTIPQSDELDISQVNREFSTEETLEIAEFCRGHRITLSTLLHGAWALVVREYTDTKQSLFVSTVSGRDPAVPGMSQAIGLFLSAMPRYLSTETDASLVSWLLELQADIHKSAQYEFTALGEIQENIDKSDSAHYFDSIVTIGGHESELDISQQDFPFTFTNIHYQSTQSHYDLAFLAFPGKTLEYSLVYEPKRFSEHDITQMSGFLYTLVRSLIAMPDHSPSKICRSIQTDRVEMHRTQLENAKPKIGSEYRRVQDWIESTVNLYPDKVAVCCGEQSITFIELDAQANKIANMLLDQSDGSDRQVGLMLPRSIEQIVAMLGILKAGFAYVPIDVSYPDTRVQALVSAASLCKVLVSNVNNGTDRFTGVEFVSVENSLPYSTDRPDTGYQVNNKSSTASNINTEPDDLAYVMFTSGSTGLSKGVMISHDNLIYSTAARLEYYQNKQPNFLLLSSISFDSSVAGIYWALCGGGTLILPLPDQEKDIVDIAELIEHRQATHTLCLPSYYDLLLKHTDTNKIQGLKAVILAGEVCSNTISNHHFSLGLTAELFNEYGPTEACVWSTVYKIKGPTKAPIPIGHPIGNSYLEVYNQKGYPCPPGVEGELVIGGNGLSPGYLNESLQTANRFFDDVNSNGETTRLYKTGDLAYYNDRNELIYTGRIDRQLKIRGYRIEPGEIEAALERHPTIAKALVVGETAESTKNDKGTEPYKDRSSIIQSLLDSYSPIVLQEHLDKIDSRRKAELQSNVKDQADAQKN